jgi:hypothetical protein
VPQLVQLRNVPASDVSGLDHFLNTTETKYFLIHLACSFDPIAGEHFSRASLEVSLEREDHATEPAPVAWSMEPRCLPQITELSRTQKIDASAKLVGLSLGQERRSTRTECLVRAFNELQSNPRWDFRHTKGAALVGTQRLIMVVQSPVRAIGSAVLKARTRRRRFLRYEATELVAGPRRF